MMNKLMKKIAIALTAATLTLTATSTAFAYDGIYVSFEMENTYGVRTCVEEKVEIRTEPSVYASVVGYLQRGEVVEINAITDNGWVHLAGGGYVEEEALKEGGVVKTNKAEEEDYQSMSRSDAIANVLDQALDSGLFTQREIDNAVNSIMELENRTCYTEGEIMGRDDAISGILNEMQQEMIDNGYLAY